jgi:hypothetical protein
MTKKRAALLGLMVLLMAEPLPAQETSQPPQQRVERLSSQVIYLQQKGTARMIWTTRRSTNKWVSLPSNCGASALCPVW